MIFSRLCFSSFLRHRKKKLFSVRVTLQNYQESKDWYCTQRVLYKANFSAFFFLAEEQRTAQSFRKSCWEISQVKIDSRLSISLSHSLTLFFFDIPKCFLILRKLWRRKIFFLCLLFSFFMFCVHRHRAARTLKY